MNCETCNTRVYERNFDARNRDDDTAAICEECLDKSKHLRCMGTAELEFWENDRIYLCQECYANISDDSDYDNESDSDIDSQLLLELIEQFDANEREERRGLAIPRPNTAAAIQNQQNSNIARG